MKQKALRQHLQQVTDATCWQTVKRVHINLTLETTERAIFMAFALASKVQTLTAALTIVWHHP